MNLLMIMRISLRALVRNKLRTFLTMLGIIIGVATVISMLAIGNGATQSVQSTIQSLGTNVLMVFPGSSNQGGVRTGAFGNTRLTVDDAEAIGRECPSIATFSEVTQNFTQVIYSGQNWATTINGVGIDFTTVRNWPVKEGRPISPQDVRTAAKVCLLGQVVIDNLFNGADPIDKTIRVKNIPMRVIGVLNTKGDTATGVSQDDVVMVPYTTAMKRLFHLQNLRYIVASAQSEKAVDTAKDEISALLRQRHRIRNGEDDDFTIRTQAEYAETASGAARIMTLLLGGIASVSLLVGGIGIMNIMLVSVTERIREIGIRMALGARAKDIMAQFLVEAMVLSLLGGTIGIVLGYGGSTVAAHYSSWPLLVSTSSIVLSFGFSAFVGIFFGFYPAYKASQLDPIEALRHE
jgi:putative ABC transport system permease protein